MQAGYFRPALAGYDDIVSEFAFKEKTAEWENGCDKGVVPEVV